MGIKQTNEIELNYLSQDIQTGEIYRIFGCTSRDEAEQFIGAGQKLLVLTDAQAKNLIIIE